MWDLAQPPGAILAGGSDLPVRKRPHLEPRSRQPDSRCGQIFREVSELGLPSLDMAFVRPQLGWQAGKARFDHMQTCACRMRLEGELDQRHRRLARVGLPAKREA